MNFVHSLPTTLMPQVARGPIPLNQWDLWVDSGDQIVMVADAPDESIKDNPTARWEWLRGKTIEWFGGTVNMSKIQLTWLADGRISISAALTSSHKQ
jgi:hypothetical protein